MSEDILQDFIEEEALASQFKVSIRTLRRYRNLPDGLPYVRVGGHIFYRISAVRKWIESRERRPNPRRA